MFSFVFNIIYITERDIYKCGPLIRCEGPVMEEGGWHKRFSSFFVNLCLHGGKGKSLLLAVKLSQHLGMGDSYLMTLRNSGMVKNVLRVILE